MALDEPQLGAGRADIPPMSSAAVCSACGGEVVHVGTYPVGSGAGVPEPSIEVGFCLACGEALRLVERANGARVAEFVLQPPPT
jgi:hypothetical protein